MGDRILVLQGGTSGEREISLRSSGNVVAHLRILEHEVTEADPADAGFDLAGLVRNCDVVLPILHGAGGEDGTLQRRLEELGVPFLGSGSAACELTFDKRQYRDFITGKGIHMAKGEVVGAAQFQASALRHRPYVLKPVNGGSSIDTVLVHDLANEPGPERIKALFAKYPQMLLEELIVGQELTVGILGDEVLPVILIIPPEAEDFDYENKYNGRTQELVDSDQVAPLVKQKAQALALQLHQLTGCRHLSRSDMIATADGELYVLETNTIPGLTEQSLLPKAAAAAGYDMTSLAEYFLKLAKGI